MSNDFNHLDSLKRLEASDVGIPVNKVNDKHYQLSIENAYSSYVLDVKDQDLWYTYGLQATPPIEGDRIGELYQEMLEINADLNGPKIGLQDGSIVMVSEEPKATASEATMFREIASINAAHEKVYPKIIERASELDLKFRDNEI